MYQSSSSHKSTAQNNGGGLSRYGSAPGSLLSSIVDSVIGPTHDFSAVGSNPPSLVSHYFTGESSSFGSVPTSCKVSTTNSQKDSRKGFLQRSFGCNESGQNSSNSAFSSSYSSLFRQRSSPPGFLNHLSTDTDGFSIMRGNDGSYAGEGGPSRLKSHKLSFNGQDSLSRIPEVNESPINGVASSSMSFGIDSWDGSTSLAFTIDQPNNKRSKNEEFFTIDPQFGVTHTSSEMGRMENFMHIPEDSVTCKIRAKRGCATHPRSIAERERRTRISGKLKKLQELVPNMDKQTSYADMLDLAVDHIKGLQNQVKKLQKERENCTCGCKEESDVS